jgi:hypothetical protein
MDYYLLTRNLQSVARIASALETYNDVGPARQQVHDFPFSFVSPLSAHYNQSVQTSSPFLTSVLSLHRDSIVQPALSEGRARGRGL